jgi:hypothetical protein
MHQPATTCCCLNSSSDPQACAFEQECVALSTKVPASEVTSFINIVVVVADIVIVFPDMSLSASFFVLLLVIARVHRSTNASHDSTHGLLSCKVRRSLCQPSDVTSTSHIISRDQRLAGTYLGSPFWEQVNAWHAQLNPDMKVLLHVSPSSSSFIRYRSYLLVFQSYHAAAGMLIRAIIS